MSRPHDTLELGDNINTDDIIPASRCTSVDPEWLRHYAFEHIIGEGRLLEYDAIEAGRNFGCGSSREHAPLAIKSAGIREVRARSFAEIFYRNSINIGLPLRILGEARPDPVVEMITGAGGLIPFNLRRREEGREVPRSQTAPRAMNVVEKLLARASGNDYVRPGETVFAKVDLAMSHDAVAGPVARMFHEHFGREAKVWDAGRLVLVADHFIQVEDVRPDPRAPRLLDEMRRFAEEQGCHLLDVVSPGDAAGICHVLLPERGFIRPGMIVAGTDSHTCTYGAFGCFATGVGTTDMANILANGEMWVRVPPTIAVELSGRLPEHVNAKDIMLFLLGRIGCDGATGRVLEFRGELVEQLGIDERMTLANMAIECGAMCGLIAADARACEYLSQARGKAVPTPDLAGDTGCEYERVYRFDLSDLKSQVACPPSPDNVVGVDQLGDVAITRAYIGSCTGGKLFDLQQAAEVLKGRRVAPGVSLFAVPASQAIRLRAEELGYMQVLRDAGARILKSGCGACINAGHGGLGRDEVGVYATNRNFQGRSGDPSAKNYLASPRVVAISAVRGKITDQLGDP